MSIHQLTPSTSRLLHASQVVPSFEQAVIALAENAIQNRARTIQISISPEALRFTVHDDGRGFSPADWPFALQPGCTSLQHGRGQSLAALSAVAAVELRTRCGHFRGRRFVRGGKLLEDITEFDDHGDARQGRHDSDGVSVDVWELFHNLPVRRRAETSRHPTELLDATRDRIVALSLANPQVAITVQSSNGVSFYESNAHRALSIDMIQAAFGVDHSLEWEKVTGGTEFVFDGFVARRGYNNASIGLISLDGFPVTTKSWIDKAVKRAWKAYISRQPDDWGSHKFPAYVLNCRSSGKGSNAMLTRENVARTMAPSRESENQMISVVHAALHGVKLPHRRTKAGLVDAKELSRLASARKRKASTLEGRFADALVCKRPRWKEASVWASQESRWALNGPLSKGSGGYGTGRRIVQERQQAVRLRIGRPSSAQKVELAYKKSLPGWSNPCFKGKALVSRKALSTCEDIGGAHHMFLKCTTTIDRETIGRLRVVGQVDHKFIVVADGDSAMYAVDQHAASERYMYEKLLKQSSADKVQCASVSPPRQVRLSHKQRMTCMYHSNALLHWGWQVRVGDGAVVEICGAPSLRKIGVILDGDEQFRSYLDSLATGIVKDSMPPPVLEAVARAACHSAVRFGDILSPAQCKSIIGSLAECNSPFTCAHGRPSIVPLVVFDKLTTS